MTQARRVRIIGPIRQEVLSGIAHTEQFTRLRDQLSYFRDEPIVTTDYEAAARMYNTCRAKGIQGSQVDYLICAVASRLGDQIYTTDGDFKHYAKHLPVRLFETP